MSKNKGNLYKIKLCLKFHVLKLSAHVEVICLFCQVKNHFQNPFDQRFVDHQSGSTVLGDDSCVLGSLRLSRWNLCLKFEYLDHKVIDLWDSDGANSEFGIVEC